MLLREKKAQTAIEYLLLLMTVVTIVLVGFRTYLPRVRDASNVYYNRVVPGIMGTPSRCGDGSCAGNPYEDCERCPVDCGSC